MHTLKLRIGCLPACSNVRTGEDACLKQDNGVGVAPVQANNEADGQPLRKPRRSAGITNSPNIESLKALYPNIALDVQWGTSAVVKASKQTMPWRAYPAPAKL